ILGVEPAKNIAAQANKDGIETVAEFFLPKVAKKLAKKYERAKVITANNVFAHTDDVDAFVGAVKELLAEDGVYVFEAQYLGDLLAKNLFDIVYHEHVCYYHATPMVQFFRKHGMEVFDVERPAVHGGSIRVYVGKGRKMSKRLQQLLQEEEKMGLNTLAPYQEFAARIEKNKQKLRQIIDDIKQQGKRIAGYGAPAKATTVCYAFGIDGKDLEYIVDDSPLKQGRLMPGTHIPIVSSAVLRGEKPHFAPDGATRGTPDYLIILAWNFAEPIMKNNAYFAEAGGKWIVPVPEPKVI
ncbi:MAG: class I SAM-dependent methyltransferase, partial [Patescibacteria group bacterium]